MNKDYFLIVDTETTMPKKDENNPIGMMGKELVADFGAIVVDRKGNIIHQCAVLVKGVYGEVSLFYMSGEDANNLWSKQVKDRRFTTYEMMLENGTRTLNSVVAINRWLERVMGKYNPMLTAYNLSFDLGKCENTGIDLSIFSDRFCLWYSAVDKWGQTKKYKNFVLDVHAFRPPTDLGNMSYRTNAETMARFILNKPNLDDEPHTALEDAIEYELPILLKLIKGQTRKQILTPPKGYNWRDYQVKDHFTAK